ncbi:MAG: family oxidoreductase [Pseudomonas sp.]|jgi:short-subunit dehydrogenase|uniref:SDR family NAD(P)-dependent oxidoreductase n=1 Tax=Pseudomonas sp. TaxID=306 RepID=UPI00260D9D8B|nr:SDR family oxidoreductase [Pseudomonas sp.]MDB6047646.1 family oxidoreductase [Pseudomonas sp.]
MSTSNSTGTALITGASSGIGFTYADRLAKRGYDLLLVARDQGRLEEMATRLRETGVKVEVLKADLIDKDDLDTVQQRLRTDASISLLVNNAGVASVGTLAASELGGLDRMIQLNVVALTYLASAAADNFSKAGRGSIINIASVVPLLPERFNATYAATKAYVLSLTQSLEAELKVSGVRVQAVLPGATRTEIFDRSGMDLSKFPAEMVMEVGEMVDAALAGFDQGELVTIPSLADAADWDAFITARSALGPNLSLSSAAARYKKASAA